MDFTNIYIERCNKETEEVITKEDASFLNTKLTHLKHNSEEFLYIESTTFEQIKADALSFELDDVFKTYMVLLGFKVQKKYANVIKTYLDENLHGEDAYYSASFSVEDGMWDLNIPLNFIKEFNEVMTLNEALTLTIHFLHGLVKEIEQQ